MFWCTNQRKVASENCYTTSNKNLPHTTFFGGFKVTILYLIQQCGGHKSVVHRGLTVWHKTVHEYQSTRMYRFDKITKVAASCRRRLLLMKHTWNQNWTEKENQRRALEHSFGDEVGQAKGSDMTRNWIAIRRFWIRRFFDEVPTEATKRKWIYRKSRKVVRIEGELNLLETKKETSDFTDIS